MRIVEGITLTEKTKENREMFVYQNCTQAVLRLNSGLHTGNTDIMLDLEVTVYDIMSQKLYIRKEQRNILHEANGRLTGLFTYCVETALCDRLLKER